MQRAFTLFPLLAMLALIVAYPASAEQALPISTSTCLQCHGEKINSATFASSVHGKNSCTSCHIAIVDVDKHSSGGIPPEKVQCVRCHKKEAGEHYASVHMLNSINCSDCHNAIHEMTSWKKDKRKVVETCQQCHDKEAAEFLQSSHGISLMAGNQDSPSCNDCHGLHEIKPRGDQKTAENTKFHSAACMKCHSDEKMMKRNGVFNLAVKTYEESYHGKNYRLGYPELVAGCADCHTAHLVLPPSDARSSISSTNLVKTCQECHADATPLFAKFQPHGDHTDRENYPILYWTFISMSALLAGTFAVFWVHTILWMFRGFVENRLKQAALEEGHIELMVADGHKQYRRFSRLHIFLHLLVITSFLGLALTGLPLKFSGQQWAITLMDMLGGTANAALIHRICAVITFVYFSIAIVMSLRFLFIRKDIPGNWLQRLFGPDSLFPNLRDVKDITAMVRWFLFKGPKPTFERWTYWEKFDFLAVFWGMFAIGGSGLMLWFPEFFSTFLPGWMFNVATIVHSDEALLATGFIFTVHFFNTHGRPEKFPMDFVIFNGQISKHELMEERRDQWQRYEEAGITEQFAAKKSSGILYDFLIKGFGFVALFIGIILLFLMIYAILTGGMG
jgi:cytochrome b subunit of formate dehydrogenase